MTLPVLFGSEMSYFSGKARAYLRWKGVDFTEVAPTPSVMKAEIIANIGWPVIPVWKTTEGEYVQDTADIIAHCEAAYPGPAAMPATPVQRFITHLIELFADEWLKLPAMHYRWNHNEEWIYGEFGKNAAPGASHEEQYEAGKAVGARFRGFVPILGISDATAPGIEAAYEQFLDDFSAHLEVHPYALGSRASYSDFALIGPLYAHQYRDKFSGAHMKRHAPRVADWVERVIAGEGRDGEFAADDAIPETLLPILRVQMTEQLPVLAATNDCLGKWAETAKSGDEVPRGFEMIPFETGGHEGEQMALSFALYRLQDALDAYAELDASARPEADALLSDIGGENLATWQPGARLDRKSYRVVLA